MKLLCLMNNRIAKQSFEEGPELPTLYNITQSCSQGPIPKTRFLDTHIQSTKTWMTTRCQQRANIFLALFATTVIPPYLTALKLVAFGTPRISM